MSEEEQIFHIGLTDTQTCSYLPAQQERLAVVMEKKLHSAAGYNFLIQAGFRRSQEMLYRPHCDNCSACESLRIDVAHFTPSKSQKRQLKQLDKLRCEYKETLDDDWFALYSAYIEQRHADGSMYPPDKEGFLQFIQASWQTTRYLHLYQDEQLIAVAVTDSLPQGLSAMYSFFSPTHPWSLGSLCVLAQLVIAKKQQLPWIYLGYQIDECDAMNYKKKFTPHQRYRNECWQDDE